MASASDYSRIFALLDGISTEGNKIDDYASRTDIQGNIARTYAEIGERARSIELVEKALDISNRIVYDYRRVQEQAFIADIMARMGRKVQALNVLKRAETDARKLKDLPQKVSVSMTIARLFAQLKEQEQHDEVVSKTIKAIETSTQPAILTFGCWLQVYRSHVLRGDERKAAEVFGRITTLLTGDETRGNRPEMLREIATTLVALSRAIPDRRVEHLMKAAELATTHKDGDDVDIVHATVLKEILSTSEQDWIQGNLATVLTLIDRIEKPRVKMENIYAFLVKAYTEKLELDPAKARQLIQVLDGMDKASLSPSRYVTFQIMELHLSGMFVGEDAFLTGIEALLNELLRSPRFRRNLPEKVQEVLLSVVEFFTIVDRGDTTILDKAVDLTTRYGLVDIKDRVLKEACLAILAMGLKTKDSSKLERAIDLSKQIQELDERLFVSIRVGDGFYDVMNQALGKDIITGCIDEVMNVKRPKARIKARLELSDIILKRHFDVDGALGLLEEATQDVNLYLAKITSKTVAFSEITFQASKTHAFLVETEGKAKQQKYASMIASAQAELDSQSRTGIKKAISTYEQALSFLNATTDRYEYTWVNEQIDRLQQYMAQLPADKEVSIEQIGKRSRDAYKVSKSDLACKQAISWRKKREVAYHVLVTNNARVAINELTCRIKKHAGAFLDLISDGVRKIPVLNPGETFTAEFSFLTKKDVVPGNAVEAEVYFYDMITQQTVSIDLDKPGTSSGFRFFAPKSVMVDKLDKIRAKLEKKTHEIALPFNVYITWKKIVAMLKAIPFKVIQKDYNEIADHFFGVVRLYAESRWVRRKNDTIVQIITSGGADEGESNVKLEIYCEPSIFYNLVNLFQEQIEVFTCPNPACTAPLDTSKIKPDSYGTCKYCSDLFFLEANVKKADKPLKVRHVKRDGLATDDDFLDFLSKRVKELKKSEESLAKFLESVPAEQKEDARRLLGGELKIKDLVSGATEHGGELLLGLLVQA